MGAYSMSRGDTRTFTETIQPLSATGQQVFTGAGVAGWSFWLTVKFDPADPDSAALFQKVPAAWSIQAQGGVGTAAVVFCVIQPADTASAPPYQSLLYYDVQAKDASGNIFTLESGSFTITPDVTVSTV